MPINNLSILVLDCDVIDAETREKMLYKTFKTKKDMYDYILANTTEEYKNISYNELQVEYIYNLFGLDDFILNLNNDTIWVDDAWVIPVFIESVSFHLPDDLLNGIYEKNNKNNSKSQEVIDILKENGGTITIDGNKYEFKEDALFLNEIKQKDFDWLLDKLKCHLDLKNKIEKVADRILEMDVYHITKLMRHIGLFGEHVCLIEFSDIGELINEINSYGYDISADICCGRDYYAYGSFSKDGVYTIISLPDERSNFESILKLKETSQIIYNNKEYYKFFKELYNEWKNNTKIRD